MVKTRKTKKTKKSKSGKTKSKSKKSVTKITPIKSSVKIIKKQDKEKEEKESESTENQEAELEEKTEQAEQEVRTLSFQNFIETSSKGPSLTPVSNLEAEPMDLGLESGFESPSRERDEEKQTNIEQYALTESSMEQYQELVRQQARMSSEVSPIRAQQQEINLAEVGREREAVGTEAGLINTEELMGMQGGRGARGDEDYVMTPSKEGFELDEKKSNIPFQEPKKTYEEFE